MKQVYLSFLALIMSVTFSNVATAQFESNPLSQAVDNTRVEFVTESPAFFRQTNVFSRGGDAAQAGAIPNDGVTVMAVEVQGPTTVSFDWRVSSELDFDFLAIVVLDQNFEPTSIVEAISGETGFERMTVQIPAGRFFPTWGYIKDGSISNGLDTGWIDNVVIGNVSPSAPEISQIPNNVFLPAVINILLSED